MNLDKVLNGVTIAIAGGVAWKVFKNFRQRKIEKDIYGQMSEAIDKQFDGIEE